MAKNGKILKMTKLKNLLDSEDVYIKENVLPVHLTKKNNFGTNDHFDQKLVIFDLKMAIDA